MTLEDIEEGRYIGEYLGDVVTSKVLIFFFFVHSLIGDEKEG